MNKQLTKFEKLVFECISTGKEHPISQENLAKATSTTRRNITATIRNLRLKGRLVGSSRSSINGYYKIKTNEEFFENIGMLSSQRDTLSKTITAMMKTFDEKESLIDQQSLFNQANEEQNKKPTKDC